MYYLVKDCNMNTKGFSLLEALLAATVLFIGITVVMSSLTSSLTMNTITEEQNLAITAIANEVEMMKSMGWDELEKIFPGPPADPIAEPIVSGSTLTFPVAGLLGPDGNTEAVGIIELRQVPDLENPPAFYNMEDLMEVYIRIEYSSDMRTGEHVVDTGVASDVEEVTVWISPKY